MKKTYREGPDGVDGQLVHFGERHDGAGVVSWRANYSESLQYSQKGRMLLMRVAGIERWNRITMTT